MASSSEEVLLPKLTNTHKRQRMMETMGAVFSLKPGEYHISPIKISKRLLDHPIYRSLSLFPFWFKLKMVQVYNGGLIPGLVVDKIHIEDEHITDRFEELNTREKMESFIYDNLQFAVSNIIEDEKDDFVIRFFVYFHWIPFFPPKKGEYIHTLMGYTNPPLDYHNIRHCGGNRYYDDVDDPDEEEISISHPLRNCRAPCVEHIWYSHEDGYKCHHDTHFDKSWGNPNKDDKDTITEEEWNDGMGYYFIKIIQEEDE